MSLKALVQVDVMVDGERKSFFPGDPLPELHPHDVAQLKAMHAVEDEADTAAAEKKAKADERAAAKKFAEARKAVLGAEESKTAGAEDETDSQGKKAKAEK